MRKPYLIIVTGAPGSGKSTYSKKLAENLHLPLIGRDDLKEGYVTTAGMSHDKLPEDTNLKVSEIFFRTVENYLDSGISLIAEGAFQHKVWSHFVNPMMDKCQLKVLICKTDKTLERRKSRAEADPKHEYYHGKAEFTEIAYDEPKLCEATYHIDTTENYSPNFEEIREIIFKGE